MQKIWSIKTVGGSLLNKTHSKSKVGAIKLFMDIHDIPAGKRTAEWTRYRRLGYTVVEHVQMNLFI